MLQAASSVRIRALLVPHVTQRQSRPASRGHVSVRAAAGEREARFGWKLYCKEAAAGRRCTQNIGVQCANALQLLHWSAGI